MLKTYNLNLLVPQELQFSEEEMQTWIMLKLYESGNVSAGKVCEIFQINRQSFLKLLQTYQISWGEISSENLEKDFQNAQNYSR